MDHPNISEFLPMRLADGTTRLGLGSFMKGIIDFQDKAGSIVGKECLV